MNMDSELKNKGAKLQLDELLYYKKLGFGQFGSVYLVSDKHHEQLYALKCVSKLQIVEQRLEKHLQVQNSSVLQGQRSVLSKRRVCWKCSTSHSSCSSSKHIKITTLSTF